VNIIFQFIHSAVVGVFTNDTRAGKANMDSDERLLLKTIKNSCTCFLPQSPDKNSQRSQRSRCVLSAVVGVFTIDTRAGQANVDANARLSAVVPPSLVFSPTTLAQGRPIWTQMKGFY